MSSGIFEVQLLAAIRSGIKHGTALISTMSTKTGRAVSPGQVYLSLKRLEKRGFVAANQAEPTSKRGGRSKKEFSLTDDGDRFIVSLISSITSEHDDGKGLQQVQG